MVHRNLCFTGYKFLTVYFQVIIQIMILNVQNVVPVMKKCRQIYKKRRTQICYCAEQMAS